MASRITAAHAVIEEDAEASSLNDDGVYEERKPEEFANDRRWPNFCDECGRLFDDSPVCHRQVNELWWMEGGEHRFAFGVGHWDFPVGAVERSTWRDVEGRPPSYKIGLPGGTLWNTNDRELVEASNSLGAYWTVAGEAPFLTVTPSINVLGVWHGFITNGQLVDA